MNRKHNPWASLIALLLLAVVLVLICTGCGETVEAAEASERFTFETVHTPLSCPSACIITDTETGVQYLFVRTGYAGGLTVLQPAETTTEE